MLELVNSAHPTRARRLPSLALSGVLCLLAAPACSGPGTGPNPEADSTDDAPLIPPPAEPAALAERPVVAPPVEPPPPAPGSDGFDGRLFRFAESKVHALLPGPGGALASRLVVPIVLAPGVLPGEGVRVRIGEGPERMVPLARVGVPGMGRGAPTQPHGAPGGRLGEWLGRSPGAGRWEVSRAATAAQTLPLGAWVLEIDVSAIRSAGAEAAASQVFVEGSRLPLVLHGASAVADVEQGGLLLGAAARASWAGTDPEWVGSLLAPLAHSPLSRWRVRAVCEAVGLDPGALDTHPAAGLVRRADQDALIEALAAQAEWRWRLALGRLHRADKALAERVAGRLMLALGVDQSRRVPAWPAESADLDALLSDLLDPDLLPDDAASRALAWVTSQPLGVAWVIDDAGRADVVASDAVATIGVANLGEASAVCWGRPASASGVPARLGDDMVRVPGGRLGQVLVACPPTLAGVRAEAARLAVRVGSLAYELGVFAPAARLAPPGFSAGPFAADWSHAGWLAGISPATGVGASPAGTGPQPMAARSATAALLHRATAPPADPAEEGGGDRSVPASRLVLYVECAITSDPAASTDLDFVRLWLGPSGRPSAVLAIDARGRVVDQTAAARARPAQVAAPDFAAAGRSVPAVQDASRWRVWVPIPEAALAGGVLRLGLERTDGLGEHSAWPRPMMPWQVEPGRVAIDVTTWP